MSNLACILDTRGHSRSLLSLTRRFSFMGYYESLLWVFKSTFERRKNKDLQKLPIRSEPTHTPSLLFPFFLITLEREITTREKSTSLSLAPGRWNMAEIRGYVWTPFFLVKPKIDQIEAMTDLSQGWWERTNIQWFYWFRAGFVRLHW